MARKDIFANIEPFKIYTIGEHKFQVPIRYYRVDCFFAGYSANYKKIKEIMPSERLKPVRILPGRGIVGLVALEYITNDIGPYGEFAVCVPSTCKHQGKTYAGIYIHRLPVTTDLACAAGRHVWGFPKFVCDMDIVNGPLYHDIALSDKKKLMLGFKVKKHGFGISSTKTADAFTIKDKEIIFTSTAMQNTLRVGFRGDVTITLGQHEMAKELAGLDLGKKPLFSGDLADNFAVLPHGISLGAA